MHLLELNQDKINWFVLSVNPGAFTYDYDAMKRSRRALLLEIAQHS